MASKIHTQDPKHHSYVSVNKRERKKRPKRLVRLLSLLFPKLFYEPNGWRSHWGYDYKADNEPKTKIIYNDCNHKSYRKMVKTPNGWVVVGESTHIPIKNRHGWLTRYKTIIRTFRQSSHGYNNQARHFSR